MRKQIHWARLKNILGQWCKWHCNWHHCNWQWCKCYSGYFRHQRSAFQIQCLEKNFTIRCMKTVENVKIKKKRQGMAWYLFRKNGAILKKYFFTKNNNDDETVQVTPDAFFTLTISDLWTFTIVTIAKGGKCFKLTERFKITHISVGKGINIR